MKKQEGQHGQEDVVDGPDVADLKQLCQQRLPRHKLLSTSPGRQRSGVKIFEVSIKRRVKGEVQRFRANAVALELSGSSLLSQGGLFKVNMKRFQHIFSSNGRFLRGHIDASRVRNNKELLSWPCLKQSLDPRPSIYQESDVRGPRTEVRY